MRKTIKLKDAVGTKLAHDITEIRPGEFKGAAFRKGHTVCNEDLCKLQRLGKNHLYILDLDEDEIHENEAAAILASALAGAGIVWKDEPKEGKIQMVPMSGAVSCDEKAATLAGHSTGIDEMVTPSSAAAAWKIWKAATSSAPVP